MFLVFSPTSSTKAAARPELDQSLFWAAFKDQLKRPRRRLDRDLSASNAKLFIPYLRSHMAET